MNLDPEILEKIKSMDQNELSDKINEISRILGIDRRRIEQVVGDPERIRRKIGELGDEDIRRIVRSVDPARIENIRKSFEE